MMTDWTRRTREQLGRMRVAVIGGPGANWAAAREMLRGLGIGGRGVEPEPQYETREIVRPMSHETGLERGIPERPVSHPEEDPDRTTRIAGRVDEALEAAEPDGSAWIPEPGHPPAGRWGLPSPPTEERAPGIRTADRASIFRAAYEAEPTPGPSAQHRERIAPDEPDRAETFEHPAMPGRPLQYHDLGLPASPEHVAIRDHLHALRLVTTAVDVLADVPEMRSQVDELLNVAAVIVQSAGLKCGEDSRLVADFGVTIATLRDEIDRQIVAIQGERFRDDQN